jgi:hypothetical protein
MGELCGSYVEGIRCRECDRIVLPGVDPTGGSSETTPNPALHRTGYAIDGLRGLAYSPAWAGW